MVEDLEDRHKKSKMRWVMITFSLLAIVLNYLHRLSFNYLAADGHLRDIISVEAYEYNTTAFFVAFMLSNAVSGLVIDQLSVHEDMAGKNGPLIGPEEINKFIKPYFSTVWKLLSSRGTKLFDMDSDGDIRPVLDVLLESGLNSMHPFEPAAGMDIVEIRKKYGKHLAIRGGINKFALTGSKEEIRRELENKMQPFMVKQGGTAFGLDHRIVNGTTIENYRYYVNLGREILNLPPLDSKIKGWARMAF